MIENLKYWWKYRASSDVPAGILVALITFMGVGLYPLIKYSNTHECNQYQEVTGRETKMVGMNCYMKYNGEWYSPNEFRVIAK